MNNKKILVPLSRYDRSEAMVPYVEKITRPGMKVIFLIPYPVDGYIWGKEEYGLRAAMEAKKLGKYYSWEGNRERAREKVAPAFEALRAKGIEASVDVYAGSLKKAVRSHVVTSDVHLVVTKAGIGSVIKNLLSGRVSVLGFRRAGNRPVCLVHPSAVC
jgi:hypothetical protein